MRGMARAALPQLLLHAGCVLGLPSTRQACCCAWAEAVPEKEALEGTGEGQAAGWLRPGGPTLGSLQRSPWPGTSTSPHCALATPRPRVGC